MSVGFSVFYTIDQFRLPLPSEFTAVATLTEQHLESFFVDGFADDDLVNYLSSELFLLSTDFNFGEPVGIAYNATLTFTQDSFTPRQDEVEALINQAFSGGNLNTYLSDVQDLPISNLFSTATAISLELGVETRTASGGNDVASILEDRNKLLLGAGAGAFAAMLAVAGLVFGGRRREERKVRQKTLMSDGHCTVGEETYDTASRGMETVELEDVNLD